MRVLLNANFATTAVCLAQESIPTALPANLPTTEPSAITAAYVIADTMMMGPHLFVKAATIVARHVLPTAAACSATPPIIDSM